MDFKKDVLPRIKEILVRVAPDAKAILYGSQARGDARPDSDIDLMVLIPDSYEGHDFVQKQGEIFDNFYFLSLELGVEINSIVIPRKSFYDVKSPFTFNVIKEGIEL